LLHDGNSLLKLWVVMFVAAGIALGIWRGFFAARKIQPGRFKWKIFRNEALIAVVTLAFTGTVLGFGQKWLLSHGWITFASEPAPLWMIALEYLAYFVLFDTWFYWLHRLMHVEPVYKWVHKVHHFSTTPNPLTTLSETPIEGIVNGGFVPLFLTVFTIHPATMALILPTNIIIGFYVHSGFEFLPRWWNRTWATKWFITATFHDHHHRYFRYNFGGYTTVWDHICGTVRPKFDQDFDRIAGGQARAPKVAAAA